jgi:hypothetical protein
LAGLAMAGRLAEFSSSGTSPEDGRRRRRPDPSPGLEVDDLAGAIVHAHVVRACIAVHRFEVARAIEHHAEPPSALASRRDVPGVDSRAGALAAAGGVARHALAGPVSPAHAGRGDATQAGAQEIRSGQLGFVPPGGASRRKGQNCHRV